MGGGNSGVGDRIRRGRVEHLPQSVPLPLERLTVALADGRAVAELHPARILGYPAHPELGVEVGAARPAGGADIAARLARRRPDPAPGPAGGGFSKEGL